MLGLQGPFTDTGCFQNVRCGGVYYIGHDTYHVNCSLCDQNILYKLFPQHFLWHLSQEEECKLFNKNGRLVKRGQVLDASAKAEEDPIGNHECGGETVDLAEIAKLDIEINGTVTSVESEECRETLLNRKDKASTTIHEHDEKSKQKGSLQRPLLRDNRKRRNIGSSTSTNVTRSRESNVVKESPTEQRHNESIKIPSLDSLSENVDREFSTQHQTTERKNTKLDPSRTESKITFEDNDDRCESPDWLPNADERKKKEDDDKEKDYMKRFPCDECDRSYLSKRALCNHKKEKHLHVKSKKVCNSKSSHPCGFCNRRFASSSSKYRHIRMKHKTEIDNGTKPEYDDFDDHMIEDSDNRTDTCDSQSEANKTSNSCQFCGRNFESDKGMKLHWKTIHKAEIENIIEERLKCRDCDMIFQTERELRHHRVAHTGRIECDICGRPFKHMNGLETHLVRHSNVKPFKCDLCDRSFYLKNELAKHKIRHTGIMPLICEVCGKPCIDRGVLTAHMRRHTGERPAKCDVCGKSFYCIYDLNVHAVAHTTARPFVCNICGYTFQRKKALRVHKLLHSDTRKHECKICGKKFAQSSGLNTHLRTHDAAVSHGMIPNA